MATPVANDDLSYNAIEDQILRTNPGSGVLANDTDADNDVLAAKVSSNPKNPLFDFKTNGSFTYDARYHGELWLNGSTLASDDGGAADLPEGFDSLAAGAEVFDEFTYVAGDGVNEDGGTVRVKIIGVNDAPVADDDKGTFAQGIDTTISIDVLDGDTDVDVWPVADTLTVVGLADIADESGPAGDSDSDASNGLTITTAEGGTVTRDVLTGELVYEAADGFFGIDSFQYTVSDGKGGSDTGVVRVTVLPTNLEPDAVDDTRTISEDAGATPFTSVLVNDTDADDAPLIAADLVAGSLRRVDELGNTIAGATGTLVDFNSDGTFSYNPGGAFESLGVGESAFVAFDYVAYDGHGESDTATVVVEVQGANDAPSGESPDAVKVYEAGLSTGSQNDPGGTGNPITQNIDITISDPDGSDTPYVAGTSGGSTTTLTGTYGTLEFIDADTVKYTLTTNADHAAVQGHNEGITDTFTVYAVDDAGASSGPLTVTVTVVDDVNFLAVLPTDGDGIAIGTLDTLEDKTVAFSDAATATDTFTLVPGADGQDLDVVGVPDEFALTDGRTVTSEVYTDTNGNEAVRGTDSEGDVFYELEFDPASNTNLGSYTLTMFQDPPQVTNDLDFSALSAGGPQETPIVENIGFDGGFFTNGSNIKGTFNTIGKANNTDDFINPNNAGGIGIGNGNIDQFEALVIDVSGSSGNVSALELDVKGAGGGVGTETLLWEAYDGAGVLVDSGSITRDFSGQDALTLTIDPDADFAKLYLGFDASITDGNSTFFDSNDTIRINRIATVEQVAADDIVLGFRINSDDGDGDHSPVDPGYEEFSVTVLGDGSGTVNPDIILV